MMKFIYERKREEVLNIERREVGNVLTKRVLEYTGRDVETD